jgi:hypothetical protein
MGTFSAAIALSPEQRQELSERVADYLATAADLAGCTTIAAPAACHCWKARRL